MAGIEPVAFFYEPIAALYCNLHAKPTNGVAAVFDWGGGSLDIALVEIREQIARTLEVEGWHRGGDDFDRLICRQAVQTFLQEKSLTHLLPDELLDHHPEGKGIRLRWQAEESKIELSRTESANLVILDFLPTADLDFLFGQPELEEWIGGDVDRAITMLRRRVRSAGISPALLTHLFLSGGTCNLALVRRELERQVAGDRIVSQIDLPQSLRLRPGGLDDIGNATALGAALLGSFGTTPIFASDIGVRLAQSDPGSDAFYAVYHANRPVSYEPRKVRFFVSDASDGVARLLVCERRDHITQPTGRLLRIIPVPIDRTENWLDVEFRLERNLTLTVSASGRVARSAERAEQIYHLNLGFRLPERQQQADLPSSLKSAAAQ